MSSTSTVNGLNAQPALPILDQQGFTAVHAAIEGAFSNARVDAFMRSLARSRVRIRDFESVLGRGLLGEPTRAEYLGLAANDQGQIREFYLGSLERVTPEVREKFFKLYAYY